MGDPRRIRKKYSGPRHPWQKSRLDEERTLIREYGLKNKKELWKINSKFKKFTNQAKNLITLTTEQGKLEKKQLINKLARLGLLSIDANEEDVLNLNAKDIFERRLQTLVFRKGLAKTMKQSRQFIVHEHIRIDGKKLTSPSHLVTLKEESTIEFCQTSSLSDHEHPERTTSKIIEEEAVKEEKEKKETKKEKKQTKTGTKKEKKQTGTEAKKEKNQTKTETKNEEKQTGTEAKKEKNQTKTETKKEEAAK